MPSRTRRAFANLHETLNWDFELPLAVAAEGPSLRNYAPINLSLIGRSSLPVPANWQPQWQPEMARGRRCASGEVRVAGTVTCASGVARA